MQVQPAAHRVARVKLLPVGLHFAAFEEAAEVEEAPSALVAQGLVKAKVGAAQTNPNSTEKIKIWIFLIKNIFEKINYYPKFLEFFFVFFIILNWNLKIVKKTAFLIKF